MAWIFNGKHFGAYTYEHWFDNDNAAEKSAPGNDTLFPQIEETHEKYDESFSGEGPGVDSPLKK